MDRRVVGRLTGPLAKWVVLVLWLAVTVVSSSFAAKLVRTEHLLEGT